MDDAKILIIGANGQLGTALQRQYPGATAVDRAEFDITDWSAIAAYDWLNVEVILNAAAYTNVDGAETPEGREQAWLINATGAGYLSRVAVEHDLTLIHISSEYVFNGNLTPHLEIEPLTPLGVYAQTKAAGDVAVSVVPKHYTIRTSWLIGDGANFVRTMIGLATKNISPTVVADQIGRLSFTPTLVSAIKHLLTQRPAYGVYNVSNDGQPASWADVTRAIFQELGRSDLTVTDTTTAEYFASKPGVAPRPLQSSFDLSKIKATGLALPAWQDDLHAFVQAELSKVKE